MDPLKITIGELLEEVASRFPENEALVDISKNVRLTYKEFLNRVNQLTKGFLKLGLKKGDHLALWSPNRWEWIVTQFAAAKIGVVLISVDNNYQLQQLEYLLR
ncbi:MAG: AMP-binding protein, partial [Deltaproteobacteria bacterium]|nr:AMP-binding protein [Deltaproteobacteria bacterium]